jgi:hypothetical protein
VVGQTRYKYTLFKDKFNSIYFQLKPRNEYFDPMVVDAISEVLGGIFQTDASKYERVLDDLEDRQKQSIEDFCLC